MDDARQLVRNAVADVLTNVMNFPEGVESLLLGRDMGPLIDRVTDSVMSARLDADHG